MQFIKTLQTTLFLGYIILLISCQSSSEKLGDFKLLPSPHQFDITGVSDLKYTDLVFYYSETKIDLPVRGELLKNIQAGKQPSSVQIILSINKSLDLKPEGYELDISKKQITITGKDKAGLLYAFMTLEQLMEDAKEQNVNLPICKIIDYPKLAYRAIHIDIKHHREKTTYYYELMDRLAKYKVNAIIVELEDKIKYERQPGIGASDALSIREWEKLCNYANERNIEISPLVQGLGHASFILKHDQYKDLRDDPKSDWAFNPLDPKTYEVQFDLYLDAIAATPHGKYLHVGGDEVHTTGRGSDKTSLELQLNWLNKVCKFAEDHGRIPIFWDDMPLKFAGVYRAMFDPKLSQQDVSEIWKQNEHKLITFIDQFPKNCIYMRWNYQTPGTYGNLKAMDWFTSKGFRVMGATAGQTRWVLMPQNESNIENIKSFAFSSIEKGLNGLLLTLWDDDSPHFELYMRGIMAFAEYTWAGNKRSTDDIKSAYRQRAFSSTLASENFAFIDSLEKPVAFWKNALLKKHDRNRMKNLNDPIVEGIIDFPDKNDKGKWNAQYAERLEKSKMILNNCDSIATKISIMKSQAVRNNYTLEVYEQVNKLARFTPEILLALAAYDSAENEQGELELNAIKRIKKLRTEFNDLRKQLEETYSKTRLLTKPEDYILDQDHHVHLANQSTTFNWQFFNEELLMKKIDAEFSSSRFPISN